MSSAGYGRIGRVDGCGICLGIMTCVRSKGREETFGLRELRWRGENQRLLSRAGGKTEVEGRLLAFCMNAFATSRLGLRDQVRPAMPLDVGAALAGGVGSERP